MPPRYVVECRQPGEVEEDLKRLWRDNLTVPDGVDHKFAWLYRDAPDRPDGVFLLGVDEGGRQWVGTAGAQVRRIHAGDRELRASLLADLAVDRAHRSLGPALALAKGMRTWALGDFDLAYGFPNRHAEGVFKHVGYRVLGSMPRYARVLRHAGFASRVTEADLERAPAALRPHVLRALHQPTLAALAGLVADAAVLALGAADGIDAASRLRLDWLDRPDKRFDLLWAAAQPSYPVVAQRTARFLDWRFPPSLSTSFAVVSSRRGGEPRAYAVVEREGDLATLRDLFGHPSDVPALLDLLVPALYTRGASTVSIRYLGAPWLAGALLARRFTVRPQSERTITIGTSERLAPELRAKLEDVSVWHLTDADEDA